MDNTKLDRARRAGEVRRDARADRGLSRADRRPDRQHPGHRGRRAEDRREMAPAVSRRRDAQGERGARCRARSAIGCARRSTRSICRRSSRRSAATSSCRSRSTICICARPTSRDSRALFERLEFGRLLRRVRGDGGAPAAAERAPRVAEPGRGAPPPGDAVAGRYETVTTVRRARSMDREARVRAARRARRRDHGRRLRARRAHAARARRRVRAKRPTCRSRTAIRARPEQLGRDAALARLRGWLSGGAPKVGHDLKYAAHVLANHGVTLGGIAHDTMLESYVLNSTATNHELGACAAHYVGLAAPKYEDIAGKGAKQLAFDQIDVATATTFAGANADLVLRLHHELVAATRRAARPRARLHRHRDAAAARARAHGARGRDGRRAAAASAEPGARDEHRRDGARRVRRGRRPVQSRLAEAAARDPLRPLASARARQDSERSAVDGGERARAARGILRPAATRARISRADETEVDVHRQACRPRSTAAPAESTRRIDKPSPRPAACRRRIRICRTFRSARRKGGEFGKRSSRRRARSSSRPTIRRSSCGSWRTCPATRACSRHSRPRRTSIARRPPRCSRRRSNPSRPISAARRRRSTSA